jgi:hypothetical protein
VKAAKTTQAAHPMRLNSAYSGCPSKNAFLPVEIRWW